MLFVCFGRFFSFIPRRSSNLLFFPFQSFPFFCFWFCLPFFFRVSSIKSLPFGSHGDRARSIFQTVWARIAPQEPNLPQKICNLPIDFANLPKGVSVSYTRFSIKTHPKLGCCHQNCTKTPIFPPLFHQNWTKIWSFPLKLDQNLDFSIKTWAKLGFFH